MGPAGERGVEARWMLEDEEPGGQSEGEARRRTTGGRGKGAIGVVVCAGTEKGGRAVVGWNTGESEERRGLSREGEERGEEEK